jgi:hypothetical protein
VLTNRLLNSLYLTFETFIRPICRDFQLVTPVEAADPRMSALQMVKAPSMKTREDVWNAFLESTGFDKVTFPRPHLRSSFRAGLVQFCISEFERLNGFNRLVPVATPQVAWFLMRTMHHARGMWDAPDGQAKLASRVSWPTLETEVEDVDDWLDIVLSYADESRGERYDKDTFQLLACVFTGDGSEEGGERLRGSLGRI